MPITVEIEGGKELRRELKRAGAAAMEELMSAMRVEAELIMRDSKRLVPVDEGILHGSGFVRDPRQLKGGNAAEITLGYGGAAKGYAVYMHEGTGPAVGRPAFFPPIEPFREWAGRVLGDEDLGFLVARAVGRRGLKPRKFLEIPFKKRARGMGRRLAKRVRRSIERRA